MKFFTHLPVYFVILIMLLPVTVYTQSLAINTDGTVANSSAILDVKSSSKGILIPRMTTAQRTAIVTPATSLIVFDTDIDRFYFNSLTGWLELNAGASFWSANGNNIYNNNPGNIGIGTNAPYGKLHIVGNADTSQLVIDAFSSQSNTSPLLKFRDATGDDIMSMHTDSKFNLFIGVGSGRVNAANVTNNEGVYNTFVGSASGYYNTIGTSNTAFGRNAFFQNIDGNNNTSVGFRSLFSNISASGNTALGSESLLLNITGDGNTAAGYRTLYQNISGSQNTALGYSSLYSNTTGHSNTAAGYNALKDNSIGFGNTGIGKNALAANTTACVNTAVGNQALYSQSFSNTGALWSSFNVAIGHQALYACNSTSVLNGIYNTATGALALNANTIGASNTANGLSSLFKNTTASQNTAIGTFSLFEQSFNNGGNEWQSNNVAVGYEALALNEPTSTANGISNTAIGTYAMRNNTTGFDNTALGSAALYTNNTGNENTAIGRQALFYNTTGINNTATGYKSLRDNGIGFNNTANGSYALYQNTSGFFNTGIGFNALYANNSGERNTAVGTFALNNNTGGSYNIAIGASSGTHSAAPNIFNTISIGNHGFLNAFQNQAFIGNTATAWIGGQVNWSTYSDARIKNNITEDVKGLDFIKRLRPVSYFKSFDAITKLTDNAETENFPGKYDGEKIKYSGFLAQEVEDAAKQSNYAFSGLHKPKGKFDLYSLSYAEFVVPLVKAMQEQQAMIESQQKIIDEQKNKMEQLEKRVAAIEKK